MGRSGPTHMKTKKGYVNILVPKTVLSSRMMFITDHLHKCERQKEVNWHSIMPASPMATNTAQKWSTSRGTTKVTVHCSNPLLGRNMFACPCIYAFVRVCIHDVCMHLCLLAFWFVCLFIGMQPVGVSNICGPSPSIGWVFTLGDYPTRSWPARC